MTMRKPTSVKAMTDILVRLSTEKASMLRYFEEKEWALVAEMLAEGQWDPRIAKILGRGFIKEVKKARDTASFLDGVKPDSTYLALAETLIRPTCRDGNCDRYRNWNGGCDVCGSPCF